MLKVIQLTMSHLPDLLGEHSAHLRKFLRPCLFSVLICLMGFLMLVLPARLSCFDCKD